MHPQNKKMGCIPSWLPLWESINSVSKIRFEKKKCAQFFSSNSLYFDDFSIPEREKDYPLIFPLLLMLPLLLPNPITSPPLRIQCFNYLKQCIKSMKNKNISEKKKRSTENVFLLFFFLQLKKKTQKKNSVRGYSQQNQILGCFRKFPPHCYQFGSNVLHQKIVWSEKKFLKKTNL